MYSVLQKLLRRRQLHLRGNLKQNEDNCDFYFKIRRKIFCNTILYMIFNIAENQRNLRFRSHTRKKFILPKSYLLKYQEVCLFVHLSSKISKLWTTTGKLCLCLIERKGRSQRKRNNSLKFLKMYCLMLVSHLIRKFFIK